MRNGSDTSSCLLCLGPPRLWEVPSTCLSHTLIKDMMTFLFLSSAYLVFTEDLS